MKKSIVILLFAFMTLFSTQAFAGGSADIPFWEYFRGSDNDTIIPKFFITNRGEEDVTVTINMYGTDGNPITSACGVSTVDNVTPFVPHNYQMVIPARGQRLFCITRIHQPTMLRGSGNISWEYTQSSSGQSKAMRKPLSVTITTDRFGYKSGGNGWTHSISRESLLVDGDIWF